MSLDRSQKLKRINDHFLMIAENSHSMAGVQSKISVALAVGFALSFSAPASAQSCAQGTYRTLENYVGRSPSTVINGNDVRVENSVLQVTHATFGNAVIDTNSISDTHYSGEPGIRLGHPSGAATSRTDAIKTTLEFFDPASPGTYLPVTDFSFRLHDIDAEDHLIVNAYDETGALIAIDASNYSLYSPTYVSYLAGNEFTSTDDDAANDTRAGTIDFNFVGKKVQRVEFTYWDTNGSGTYTIAELMGCNPAPTPVPTPEPSPVPAASWWSLAMMGALLPVVSRVRTKRRKARQGV